MNLQSAEAWAVVIASVAAALCSIIAALKSGKASESATAAKNQAGLNHEATKELSDKVDENTRLTKSVASDVVVKMNGANKCKAETLAKSLTDKDG